MKKTLAQTFAVALVASATFTGIAAAAEGDYYEGIFAQQNQGHVLDTMSTAGIAARSFGFPSGKLGHQAQPSRTVGSGDFYEGVNRPN